MGAVIGVRLMRAVHMVYMIDVIHMIYMTPNQNMIGVTVRHTVGGVTSTPFRAVTIAGTHGLGLHIHLKCGQLYGRTQWRVNGVNVI